jgi:hypothetical protein
MVRMNSISPPGLGFQPVNQEIRHHAPAIWRAFCARLLGGGIQVHGQSARDVNRFKGAGLFTGSEPELWLLAGSFGCFQQLQVILLGALCPGQRVFSLVL